MFGYVEFVFDCVESGGEFVVCFYCLVVGGMGFVVDDGYFDFCFLIFLIV